MIGSDEFPRLTANNCRVTSPASPDYNCIAWATGDTEHWWQPGVYWPTAVASDEYGIGILEQAFVACGFVDCPSATLESGFEKVAIYGSARFYTHVARQLPTGKWTSKLGGCEDIEHDAPDDVAGGLYGEVVQFMKRPVSAWIGS
jgi:hypothetical protein